MEFITQPHIRKHLKQSKAYIAIFATQNLVMKRALSGCFSY